MARNTVGDYFRAFGDAWLSSSKVEVFSHSLELQRNLRRIATEKATPGYRPVSPPEWDRLSRVAEQIDRSQERVYPWTAEQAAVERLSSYRDAGLAMSGSHVGFVGGLQTRAHDFGLHSRESAQTAAYIQEKVKAGAALRQQTPQAAQTKRRGMGLGM